MSRGPRLRRWLPWLAGLGSIFLVAAAVLAVTVRNRNINNPNVEVSSPPGRPRAPPPPEKTRNQDAAFEWPVYGYSKQRTRDSPLRAPSALPPPYSHPWSDRGHVLIEFPP